MASTETLGELLIRLKAQGQAEVDKALQGVGLSMSKVSRAATAAGAAISAGLAATMALVVKNTIDGERELARLNATVRSTGAAAGFTTQQLQQFAEDIERTSIYSAGAVMDAQTRLLTYSDIQGEMFKEATQAAMDMAAALGTDLTTAAETVGRALNYPSRAMAALAQQGFVFTDAQKEQIKYYEQTNQLSKAQTIIMDELKASYEGQADAARNTLGGALKALRNSFDALWDAPEIIRPITDGINRFVDLLNDPKTRAAVTDFVYLLVEGLGRGFAIAARTAAFFSSYFDRTVIDFEAGTVKVKKTRFGEVMQEFAAEADALAERMGNLGRTSLAIGPQAAAMARGLAAEVAAMIALLPKRNKPNLEVEPVIKLRELTLEESNQVFLLQRYMDQLGKRSEPLQLMVPVTPKLVVPDLPQLTESELAEVAEYYRKADFGTAVGNAMVESIVGGIEQAVASGSISEGFKSLTAALLSGLGSAMIRFGQSSAAFATLMDSIMKGLSSLLPGGALAASLAMIGIGAALKGVAGGMFGGRRGGGASVGGLGGSMLSVRGSDTYTRVSLPPTASAMGAGVNPLPPMSFNIIGPNDPVAQRQITELVTKAGRR